MSRVGAAAVPVLHRTRQGRRSSGYPCHLRRELTCFTEKVWNRKQRRGGGGGGGAYCLPPAFRVRLAWRLRDGTGVRVWDGGGVACELRDSDAPPRRLPVALRVREPMLVRVGVVAPALAAGECEPLADGAADVLGDVEPEPVGDGEPDGDVDGVAVPGGDPLGLPLPLAAGVGVRLGTPCVVKTTTGGWEPRPKPPVGPSSSSYEPAAPAGAFVAAVDVPAGGVAVAAGVAETSWLSDSAAARRVAA